VSTAILGAACSAATEGDPESVSPSTTRQVPLGNPGTVVAPTSTTEPAELSLSVETVVALLAACSPGDELVGPCRCALGRMEGNLDDGDIVVFEDRFSGRNEFSPELAAALVDCAGAPAPQAWSAASRNTFVTQCMKGSDRLRDLCTCASARAEQVIPEVRIRAYSESKGVAPDFVDLINDCI
jgi:hypothetical protein